MVKKIISQNIVIVRVLSHPAKKYIKKREDVKKNLIIVRNMEDDHCKIFSGSLNQ